MKTKILPVLIVAILVSSGFGMAISDDIKKGNEKIKKVEMDFPQPEIVDRGEFVKVKMEGAGYTSEAGKPILPTHTFTEKFPIGTKIIDVKCIHSPIKSMKIEKKIALAPEPIPVGLKKVTNNEPTEEPKNPFPSEWYDYRIGCGIDDGERVLFLNIHFYPVKYLPATKMLQFVDHATIKITYEKSPQAKGTGLYDMVIITPSKFSASLDPLVDHKNEWGISTKLVTLDEIYNGDYFLAQGRDEQEKIKYFIKNAIEDWDISYVLLVGSANDIPVRYSYIPSGSYENKFPSDLYYADIYDSNNGFCSWDSNDNDLFGEYNYQGRTDNVDLYPDVYLGRLACASDSEVTTVVNKIINYELHSYGQEWFNNIVVCGGDTFPGDSEDINEGEYANEQVLGHMQAFNPTKLWVSLGTLSSGNIKNAIDDGAGFVDFSGHGNKWCWATHPHGNEDKWISFYTSDAARLSNGEKLPIVNLNGCSCSKFDTGNCLGWQFVKKSGGGAVASLGASGIAYGSYGSYETKRWMGWIEVHFFKYYSDTNVADILGIVWEKTLREYINGFGSSMDDADYKTVEEWELFGDPSLEIGGFHGVYARINRPKDGYLYIFDKEVMPTIFGNTLIIGKITIRAEASAMPNEIEKVEFYIDDVLQHTDNQEPYEWPFDKFIFGRHEIKIVGHANGDTITDTMSIIIFNI